MAMPYASLSPAAAAAGTDHRSTTSAASFLFPSPFYRAPFPGGEEGHLNGTAAIAAAAAGDARWRSVGQFTASQYEELEQQALIYKHLVAGVPIPADLLLPIRRGADTIPASARFYHHPSLSYGSYFGKKLDPEPGRCRRTDGKKWRCSKEAAPDSKYCERHMHRGRNRSRKPVEAQLVPQTQPPAVSTVPSLAPSVNGRGGSSNFQGHALYPVALGGSNAAGSFAPAPASSQLQMDSATAYVAGGKDLRYAYGVRAMVDEHNPFQEASGNAIGLGMDTSRNNSWRLMPSQTSSLPLSSFPQLGALGDLGQSTLSSLSKVDRQPLSFFGSDFGGVEAAKQENQTLRPFFDEWPKARDSWPELADENANLASFSATQLSISIPMASSDFSTTSSRSPNED